MRLLVALLVWLLRAVFTSRESLALKNRAFRQQLATYARIQWRRSLRPAGSRSQRARGNGQSGEHLVPDLPSDLVPSRSRSARLKGRGFQDRFQRG